MKRTGLCDLLNIDYPIIEGGMAMPGNGELAAAVSNAGALGMVGLNPGWAPPDKQAENLRNHIRKAKNLTTKPFGVNFPLFMPGRDVREFMNIAIEEGIKVAVTSGGNPQLHTKYLQDAGMKVIHVALSVRWAKSAEAAGVDAVVASGYEAGGLLGPDEIPTFTLVPQVVDAVEVPVVAAGGIADARGFVAALALGADGIQIGTRFLATHECHIHQDFKQAIVKAIETDTVVTRRNSPPRVRGLKNEFSRRLEEMDISASSAEEIKAFLGYGKEREGIMLGDMVGGDAMAGAVVGMINEIVSAGEVVRSIVEGASTILARLREP